MWATPPTTIGRRKKNRKIRIHTRREREREKERERERKPFRAGKHPISFTSRGLLGDGRRPPGTHHKKVSSIRFSFTQEIERRRRRRRRRRRDGKVSCRWWHWFPRVEPTEVPAFNFVETDVGGEKRRQSRINLLPWMSSLATRPSFLYTQKENKRKLIINKKR